MRTLSLQDVGVVSGGQVLSDTEASNAYMMSGSVALPIVANALYATYGASIVGSSLFGSVAAAGVAGLATGAGVWIGYQVYYGIYGE